MARDVYQWFYENHKIARDKNGNKVPYKVFYSRFYDKYRRSPDIAFLKEVEQRLLINKKDREDALERINGML